MDWRKTSAPTLAGLVALCLLALFLGMRALTSDLPGAPTVTTTDAPCTDRTVTAGSKVFPADVLVSVYNAGNQPGVANRTMTELLNRGFVRGETGNVDDADGVRFVQVWAEDPDNPAVELVARQFGSRTKIVPPPTASLGPGVLVVVGDEFERFGRRLDSVRVSSDATICSPPLA